MQEPTKKARTLAEKDWEYRLSELDNGQLGFEVWGNHSAFYYFIPHIMTEAEIAAWREQGETALLRIADEVRRNEGGGAGRG